MSADELRTGMERVGLSLTDSAVSGLIGEADANGDGVVTMDEFRQLIIKYFEGGTTENMTPEELARHRRQMRKLKPSRRFSTRWTRIILGLVMRMK